MIETKLDQNLRRQSVGSDWARGNTRADGRLPGLQLAIGQALWLKDYI